MSILLATVATVAPTVVATATPVVHAVTVATTHANTLGDTLNALAGKVSATDLLVAAGVVATGVQYLLNHFANLRKTANWLVSFALPFAGTAIASVASGQNTLHLAPWLYLVSQLVYFSIEKIKSSVTTAPVSGEATQF